MLLDPDLDGVQLVEHTTALCPGFFACAQSSSHRLQHCLAASDHRVLNSKGWNSIKNTFFGPNWGGYPVQSDLNTFMKGDKVARLVCRGEDPAAQIVLQGRGGGNLGTAHNKESLRQ